MYRLRVLFLLLFWIGLTYAQPSLLLPTKTTSTLLNTKQPTFKWSQVTGATSYELYITSSTSDTAKTYRQSIPAAANVDKSKRYVTVTDTTFTLDDTVLVKGTEYYWKVRAHADTGWVAWTYPYSYFKLSTPPYRWTNTYGQIIFNHDTLGAVIGVRSFSGMSGKQLLDTVYNASHKYGIGGNGIHPDTLVSWSTSTATDTFTYQNATTYGATGKKVMVVSLVSNGVTDSIALTLEASKTDSIAAAWKPAGALASGYDYAVLGNASGAARTSLTYPGTAASFGPATINLSSMYDTRSTEYFGFKFDSPVAVADTQSSAMLKQLLVFHNTGGSNVTYHYGFAVRKARADFFDTWASNTPIIVTKPAAGDSLDTTSQTVIWESFGATPSSISFSSDGGTTFGSDTTLATFPNTANYDTSHYTMPQGPPRDNCVVEVTSPKGTGQSGVFKLHARYVAITSPTTGDSLTVGQHEIDWTNYIGASFTDIWVSLDSGKTWSGDSVLNPASTAMSGSFMYYFSGAKNVANYAAVKLCGPADTAISSFFKVEKRYAKITAPDTSASVSTGSSWVKWTNLTGSAVTTVDCTLDTGKTWVNPMTLSPSSTATKDSVLYDFHGARSSSTCNAVRIRTAGSPAADTAQSGFFTLGKAGAVFTIPTVCGNPNEQVVVTIRAKDYVVGDAINSIDLKMTFDTTYAIFDSLQYAPVLADSNWIKMMDSSNTQASANANYVRLAAFKYHGNGISADSAFVKLYFTIRDNQSIIGLTSPLVIKNSTLAASGNNAASLDVSGSTDGVLKIYSSISGHLHYMHEDTVTASYDISGDSLMVYYDSTDASNNAYFDVNDTGFFDMTNRPPNDKINFYPSASVYDSAGWANIDLNDALLAFDFQDTLSVRANIAADVNGDSVVNTSDAVAVLQIISDSTYCKTMGLSTWIFVDSTVLDSIETNSLPWYDAEKHSISYTLTHQRSNQDFFGVLRGDVNFSYGASQNVSTMKNTIKIPMKDPVKEIASLSSIVFGTNDNVNVRPGDTVWIPLTVNPGDTVIGGFTASIKMDPKIFSYTGNYKMGPSMPQNANWYVAAHSYSDGNLKVATTDFARVMTPITNNGTALLFEYAVNKNAKVGSSCPISVETQTVIDTKMHYMACQTQNGKAQVTRLGSAVATQYELSQNYPNPFNPSTTIEYAVPMDSKVDLVIYNVLGQKVATLVNGTTIPAGYHDVIWNASNFASGVYFSVIRCTSTSTGKNFQSVKKLMLIK